MVKLRDCVGGSTDLRAVSPKRAGKANKNCRSVFAVIDAISIISSIYLSRRSLLEVELKQLAVRRRHPRFIIGKIPLTTDRVVVAASDKVKMCTSTTHTGTTYK